jgi:8-amino-3,8-dideoxy-alpha-D-manno-octulosonate transaminase
MKKGATMQNTTLIAESLLSPEWPGSYFLGEEEVDYVSQVLLARSPFRYYGHDLQHFADKTEALFRERLGRKHALLTNSGTSALAIAMAAADVGPGDEVLVPGYCWVACFSAVVRAGAIPRLVDIDDTFSMDPLDLERKIGPHTKAVLLVHMNGACGDVERIAAICRSHKVTLIEDNAQAAGGSFHGKPLGSFGDMAIFSFQFNKNMTAGEGGLVVCDDDRLSQRAWAVHDQGYARGESGRVTADSFRPTWGYGARISEVAAAILYAQLQKLDDIVTPMRERNHQLYAGLSKIPGVLPRRVIDSSGDTGPFIMLIWPTPEICTEMTRRAIAAGVRNNPQGGGHARMADWGLHLYFKNESLVHKAGLNSAGRPWSDPLNAFAADYRYDQGTLPQMDDLVARTELFCVAPVLTAKTCERIIDIYYRCAQEVGLH